MTSSLENVPPAGISSSGLNSVPRASARVLVVDDDVGFSVSLQRTLTHGGYDVGCAGTGGEALRVASGDSWDVVLLDWNLPDMSGLTVLASLMEADPLCAVIVVSGRDDAQSAVLALRGGATDYLTKPVGMDHLLVAVKQACERRRLRLQMEALSRGGPAARRVLGESQAWRRTAVALQAAARAPRTQVLLTGESGTGKELAASLLHEWSDRARGPFISVNAACFTPPLLESELFGHAAGAFTGARGEKRGLLELASGGTLFLDEVGELPLELQPRLLRVLEGHPFRRVGGEREIRVDVRFISATNRDLTEEVAAGRFRLDLYHRLRVLEITLPPLRDRGEDIELLAMHFVTTLAAELGKPGITLAGEALAAMRGYAWPGNVRELRNVIERAVVLCRGTEVRAADLPREVRTAVDLGQTLSGATGAADTAGGSVRLDEVIRRHVIEVYGVHHQNVTRTARALGISRVALRRRLREYGMKPPG